MINPTRHSMKALLAVCALCTAQPAAAEETGYGYWREGTTVPQALPEGLPQYQYRPQQPQQAVPYRDHDQAYRPSYQYNSGNVYYNNADNDNFYSQVYHY